VHGKPNWKNNSVKLKTYGGFYSSCRSAHGQETGEKFSALSSLARQSDFRVSNPIPLGLFYIYLFIIYYFFDKSVEYIKKRREAQPLVHREYTKGG
jgi:hypothetical protein